MSETVRRFIAQVGFILPLTLVFSSAFADCQSLMRSFNPRELDSFRKTVEEFNQGVTSSAEKILFFEHDYTSERKNPESGVKSPVSQAYVSHMEDKGLLLFGWQYDKPEVGQTVQITQYGDSDKSVEYTAKVTEVVHNPYPSLTTDILLTSEKGGTIVVQFREEGGRPSLLLGVDKISGPLAFKSDRREGYKIRQFIAGKWR